MTIESTSRSSRRELTLTLLRWQRYLIIALTILAWVAVIGVTFWVLGHVSDALILLLLGATLATVAAPIIKWLEKFMPRVLAITIVYIIIFAGIGTLLYFVARIVVEQINQLIQYIQALSTSGGNGRFQPLIDTFQQFGVSQEQLRSVGQQATGQLQGVARSILPFIGNFFSSILNVILIALLSIYFLLSGPRVIAWLRYKTPVRQRRFINFFIDTLQRTIGGNFRGVLLLAIIISSLTGIGLSILGVPYAFLLSVVAFVMEFIPIIGFYITAMAMLLVALTQGWQIALLALGLAIIIQILEGEVLSPRILGQSVGLNPILIISALIAGSQLYGILGAFFAAPVAAVIQTMLVAFWQDWKERHPEQFIEENIRKQEKSTKELELSSSREVQTDSPPL